MARSAPAARPPALLRYGVALGAVTGALGLSELFRSFILPNPFLLFFAAVAVSAWYGGLTSGLVATLLGAIFSNYFFIAPVYAFSLGLSDVVRVGGFMLIALIITSLTEARLRAERVAHLQRQRFAVTLASIGDGVIVTDTASRITFLNAAAELLTGWSHDQAIGSDITEVFHIVNADSRQPVESPVTRVLHEGIVVGLANHTILIARDGTARPIDDSGAPIRDHTGALVGVVMVFRDVSDRQRAQQALIQSEERYRAFITQSSEGIWRFELEQPIAITQPEDELIEHFYQYGWLAECNDAMAQMYGFSHAQELIGVRLGDMLVRSDEHNIAYLRAFIRSGFRLTDAESHEVDRQGQPRYFLNNLVGIAEQGMLVRGWGTQRDITEHKRTDEALQRAYEAEQQARAEAEAAVHLRDQFLSLAAHELKTPLTTLIGNVQLIQRRAERDGSMTERDLRNLRVITDQAGRLNKMVLALLDVTRIETGQLAIERTQLDLCALTQRVVEEVRPTIDGRMLQLYVPDAPLMLNGDELRLEQVIQNLIQNALKYSPATEPITVELTRRDNHACLAVIDRGIGIPATALPQLFQRFYRAGNAEQQHISGMGIGLYVVKEIVSLHGGQVAVETSEGKGSTFTICLPLTG